MTLDGSILLDADRLGYLAPCISRDPALITALNALAPELSERDRRSDPATDLDTRVDIVATRTKLAAYAQAHAMFTYQEIRYACAAPAGIVMNFLRQHCQMCGETRHPNSYKVVAVWQLRC